MIRIKKTYNVLLEENKKLKYSLDNKSSNDKIIISSLKRINSILNDKLDHSKSLIEYLFDNNEKDENGEFVKGYQSIRFRILDEQDYVDLYANIPRRNEKGFVSNISKFSGFFRTGFDVCFSFMRFLGEENVVNASGNEINRITKINIEAVCKKIDSMDNVTFKVIKGANEDYDSFILLDMKNI